jgi:MFS family permease
MKKIADKLFPMWRVRNIAMFYVLSSIYNMWFVGGVWIFIWGMFMTKTQMGISDALTFAVGFLVELPSGVVADIVGRRKAILWGSILLCLGNFSIAFSNSFWHLTLSYLVWTIGYAFQSGATEALAYDSLKRIGKEETWAEVIGTSSVISRATSLIATGVGGFLFLTWFRLPYLTFAISGILGIIAAYFLTEIPVSVNKSAWSVKTYVDQIKDGVSTLAKPNIFALSLISLFVAGAGYMYNWGLLRPLTGDRFGFTASTLPLLLAGGSVVVILATVVLVKIKGLFKLEALIFASSLVFSVLYLVLGGPHKAVVGGIIMISLAVAGSWVDQLYSRFLNLHTKPEHRATTLSAVALFTKFPYVALALVMGILADRKALPQFTMVVGGVLLCVWILARYKYSKTHVE